MNRKTVLFLINGFGIERKESYSIYDSSLMPTFDSLTKKYLFSTISSNVNNYYDGYRNASMDIQELYNYSILDKEIEDKKFQINPNLLKIKEEITTKKGNLHIFALADTSLKLITHLKETLKVLNPDKNQKIFLHFIMSSNTISDYKKLAEVFSKINIEFNNIAPIGFIMGLSSIDNNAKDVDINFFFKMFISKVGEKWQSFTQKFDVLYGTKVLPRDAKPFIVNSNFNLGKDDTFFVYNYDNIDLTKFINTLANIRYGNDNNNFTYHSLFSVASNIKIPYMYNSTTATNYFAKNLENIKASSLIACKKEQINIINYFLNGLRNEPNKLLTYIDIDTITTNPSILPSIINDNKQDLIILNFSIEECKNTKEIKDKLKEIDSYLKIVYDNMSGSKYSIIISSLYGISKVMLNERENICQVIFSGKVPFCFVDDFITRKSYLIADGDINGIFKSAYKNINKDSKYESLVEKQNGLYRLFFNR